MTLTYASAFSGGELVGVGAQAAGLRHLWGIEIDSAIADVARANGFDGVMTADILTVDPRTLEAPDVFHASTVCTRASKANSDAAINEEGTREALLDVDLGRKVAEFIDVLRPKVFTLENVWAYRRFRAFGLILDALKRGGYMYDYNHLNAADYGVPQTRERLILRAARTQLLPLLPDPEPWQGWYQAIEDLLPGLPESKFAPWQLARLPLEMGVEVGVLVNVQNKGNARGRLHRPGSEPAATVTTQDRQRGFLLAGAGNTNMGEASPGRGVRSSEAPAHALHASAGGTTPRAFLYSNQKSHDQKGNEYGLRPRADAQPAMTVRATQKPSAYRAFVVSGQNSRQYNTEKLTIRAGDEPTYTVTGTSKGAERAWLEQGRVVKLTPRALARLQTVPDSYKLPDNPRLARLVIGNGVPCRLYQTLISHLVANL